MLLVNMAAVARFFSLRTGRKKCEKEKDKGEMAYLDWIVFALWGVTIAAFFLFGPR
jgi:hypothetical protein